MNILFVCTANTCRSPIAHGIFEKMLADKFGEFNVESAGVFAHPNDEINHMAEKELLNRGINFAHRKSVQVTEKLINESDLVFSMTANQRRLLVQNFPAFADKIHLLGDYTNRGGDIIDPFGGNRLVYETCANDIECMLKILKDMI